MNERILITDINRIIFVGKDEYKEKRIDFTRPTLTHQELIFHFVGSSTVYFNGKKLHTEADTLRFLPSGPCSQYVVDKEVSGECIDIVFNASELLFPEACVLPIKNKKIAPLFKKAFSVWVQKDEGYYLECVSILYKIFSQLQKTSYLPESQFEKIRPAVEYIGKNFLCEEKITAETLSEICGISYSYIKKLFDLKYKTSPKKYILSLKMNYACDLLRHGENSVSKIAELCGYNDVYTFSHQFKATLGISPIAFQKKYKSSK